MHFLNRLCREARGSVVVETAIALPLLAILMLGALDVSRMVARQVDLQEVAAEIAAASMAKEPGDAGLIALAHLARASGQLSEDQVVLERKIKCGTEQTLQSDGYDCDEDVEKSTFVTISLNDSYVPLWTSFGIGGPVELGVFRSVQVK